MIAGLPFEAWLLLVFSIAVPLAIELKFFFTHHKRNRKPDNGAKP
jgi:hypothetical protein